MNKTENHVFAYSLVDVVSLFLDADFLCDMMVELGNRDVTVSVDPVDDDVVQVEIQRTVPADPPALIRAISGDWVELHQREHWSGLASSDADDAEVRVRLELDAVGKPAKGRGTLRFSQDTQGQTHCEAFVEVKCSVMLVASMVEKMMMDDSVELLEQQFAHVEQALAQRQSAA